MTINLFDNYFKYLYYYIKHMQDGGVKIGHYILGRTIGHGGFGKVKGI
jgi:hypothetical protein